MVKIKHAPGLTKYRARSLDSTWGMRYEIAGPNGEYVATIHLSPDAPEDVQSFLAAPEMLKVLEEFVGDVQAVSQASNYGIEGIENDWPDLLRTYEKAEMIVRALRESDRTSVEQAKDADRRGDETTRHNYKKGE